jgi:hypothetical protein
MQGFGALHPDHLASCPRGALSAAHLLIGLLQQIVGPLATEGILGGVRSLDRQGLVDLGESPRVEAYDRTPLLGLGRASYPAPVLNHHRHQPVTKVSTGRIDAG